MSQTCYYSARHESSTILLQQLAHTVSQDVPIYSDDKKAVIGKALKEIDRPAGPVLAFDRVLHSNRFSCQKTLIVLLAVATIGGVTVAVLSLDSRQFIPLSSKYACGALAGGLLTGSVVSGIFSFGLAIDIKIRRCRLENLIREDAQKTKDVDAESKRQAVLAKTAEEKEAVKEKPIDVAEEKEQKEAGDSKGREDKPNAQPIIGEKVEILNRAANGNKNILHYIADFIQAYDLPETTATRRRDRRARATFDNNVSLIATINMNAVPLRGRVDFFLGAPTSGWKIQRFLKERLPLIGTGKTIEVDNTFSRYVFV